MKGKADEPIRELRNLLAKHKLIHKRPEDPESNGEHSLEELFPKHWWMTFVLWTTIDKNGWRPKGTDAMRLLLVRDRTNGNNGVIVWSFKDIRRTDHVILRNLRICERVNLAVDLGNSAKNCPNHEEPMDLYNLDTTGDLCWVCTIRGCKTRFVVDPVLRERVKAQTSAGFWRNKRLFR